MESISFTAEIYAPEIPAKIRPKSIMRTFDNLESGEYLHLMNDHDPKPLYYLLLFEREDKFTWDYLEDGPEHWRIAIGKK